MKTARYEWGDSIQLVFTDFFDGELSVQMREDGDGVFFRCPGDVKLHAEQVEQLITELQAWLQANKTTKGE